MEFQVLPKPINLFGQTATPALIYMCSAEPRLFTTSSSDNVAHVPAKYVWTFHNLHCKSLFAGSVHIYQLIVREDSSSEVTLTAISNAEKFS